MLPPPPPRPPQLTGANALPVNPRPAAPENVQQQPNHQQQPNQQENVHQVENQYPDGRNVYREHEAAYVVFVSEPSSSCGAEPRCRSASESRWAEAVAAEERLSEEAIRRSEEVAAEGEIYL